MSKEAEVAEKKAMILILCLLCLSAPLRQMPGGIGVVVSVALSVVE